MDPLEAVTIGDIDNNGVPDFKAECRQDRRCFGFISVSNIWIEVYHPGLVQSTAPEYGFPQKDASGTPVARALSSGRKKVTHIFQAGRWVAQGVE